jgi:hypothetical protein
MTFNPRTEALALRIYNHCTPLGWDCTHGDVAEALDVTLRKVVSVCRANGWSERLRVTKQDYNDIGPAFLPHRLSVIEVGRIV